MLNRAAAPNLQLSSGHAREHVLWMIEHHPESAALSLPEGLLFPGNHKLADPAGYEQTKRLWLEQTARSADARVIRNAVRFFEVRDKDLAETLLLNGQSAQPADSEWTAQLGRLYALAVSGLIEDGAGDPPVFDPLERQSVFAQRARVALESSSNAVLLRSALAVLERLDENQLAAAPQLAALTARIKGRVPASPQWFRVSPLPKPNP